MTRTLTLSTGSFDQDNTFGVEVKNWNGEPTTIKCSLQVGFVTEDDCQFWAMSSGAMVKSSYTQEDRDETDRVYGEEPVRNGDVVLIQGIEYVANVKGRYSDAVMFEVV